MLEKKLNIVQDISLLYELSLAVGNTLDIQKNCENFCQVLMARKNLNSASVWMQNPETNNYEVLYIEPLFRKKKESISKNHYILKRLKNNETFSVSTNDKKINQDILDLGSSKGTYAFFRLKNFGFLSIHSNLKEKRYTSFELNQLKQVMNKFAISLEACISHKQLKETTASKEKAEKNLSDSENMFRSLFEQSPLGIIIGHEEGKLIANQQFADMLGCTLEEFSKLKTNEFSPEEEEVRFYKKLKNLQSGKVSHAHMIKKYLRRDGSSFWGNLSIASLLDNNGKFKTHISFIEDYTKRRLIEESLKLSEKKLKDAQKIAKIGSYELDLRTGEISWSEEAYRIFRRDPTKPPPAYEEHIKTIHPDDLPLLLSDMEYIQKHKKSRDPAVLRYYTGEGNLIYTKGFAKEQIEDGEVIKIFGTVQDVTEQKLNEIEREKTAKSLQLSEKKLKDAQQIAKIGSYELDIRTGAVSWSEETYRIFRRDLSKAPYNYQRYIEAIHSDDLPLLFDDMEYIQKNKKSRGPAILRFYTDEGNLIYTKGYAKAKIENGEVIKLFGTIQDITEQKLNEIEREKTAKSLQLSEQKLKDAQQIAKIGSYELDLKTGDVNWSEETFRIFKRDPTKPPPSFQEHLKTIHPDDVYILHRDIAFMQKSKKSDGATIIRSYTADGNLIYTKGFAKTILQDGEVIKLVGTVQDITEQKLNEIEREKLLKEIEEVNKELENFAYIVSHDLKAPLRAITSLSQWLIEDYKSKLDESGEQLLQLLVGRVERMHSFIEGILEYSRIGRQSLKEEEIDFNLLVKSVIETLQPPAHIKVKIKNKLPKCLNERLRMEQLFQNLIGNAIKYNDKKKGIIEISYSSSPTHHCFKIKDNGLGIEEKYFEKIFQIFQTLQPRDKFESTGIGLTIVKRIIELNEGEIFLESTLGKGTAINFTLRR